ncbi:MAG TPA: PilX N-terminal domain-containing pilus assembly protein [Candidatus Saccharimonadales bacterium]|jgi:hypothetical protein|nr:PilX N-terminal domain-containing pilus assembly protein [Candidatus Saccharimonadales bacterium]
MEITQIIAAPRHAGRRGRSGRRNARGFALIMCLLLLLLLTAVSVALLLAVHTETKVGGFDVQNNIAYHAAEGAIEKMTADLAASFSKIQAPLPQDITSLQNLAPVGTAALSYPEYSFIPGVDANGKLVSRFGLISSGANQGLYAQLIPVELRVTAQTGFNAQVTMMRNVEMALVPVFQFGVFSDSDLGFFNSPNLDFKGRIHTNGDLYVGVFTGATMSFHDKVTAYGNVIRSVLPNGLDSNTYSNTGSAFILTAAGGCNAMPAGPPGPTCRAIGLNESSVTRGPNSGQNPQWSNVSKGAYNGWIVDGNFGKPGGTGAIRLSLPFTNPGAAGNGAQPQPFEIIRRPPPGEPATSAISQARLYNQAEIRVLLVDDPAELTGGANDPENIRLANVLNAGGQDYRNGVPTSVPGALPAPPVGALFTTLFAEGTTSAAVADPSTWTTATSTPLPPDWPVAPAAPPAGHATLVPAGAPIIAAGAPTTWNLLDGYLRVEYRDAAGNYFPVTREWLTLGFARNLNPPVAAAPNDVNPNAILLLQQPADRNANGVLDPFKAHCVTAGCGTTDRPADVPPDLVTNQPFFGSSAVPGSITRNNWYPINFYDAREGEARDVVQAGCTVNGIMNAVELDVNNLKRWLGGAIGASGANAVSNKDNGYILYFSDRRGMQPNPNAAGLKTGDSGLEDVINAASAAGIADRALEPAAPGKTRSPEDVNNNGVLDNFGAWNLGAGFNVNTGASAGTLTPYGPARLANCLTVGRKNAVSGARHVLKLVNGSLGNLPTKPDGTGGFTVASENPVYVLGDYNTSAADPTWANPAAAEPAHSAAAIIADAVTLLSNNWIDRVSLQFPSGSGTGPVNRPAVDTHYRVAIAAGKNIVFPAPAYTQTGSASGAYGFGTDGGVHNFLRFLETWTGKNLFYKGSMVSLYYSTYATGTFKCCGDTVYHPPVRNYAFDPLFTQPQNLPPGTPMFRDVDNLSYRQDFTPH